jgi:SpoU rRNA methylase family enzyme
MATTKDLAAAADRVVEGEVVDKEFDEGDDDLVYQDIKEAIQWLNKCMHVLDYIADKDTCPALSQRERKVMVNVSENVREFLDDIASHYDDENDLEEE